MGLEQLPGKFPIKCSAGDDVIVTFTVADGVTPYPWTGVTVDAVIVGHATVTEWTVDISTDGVLIMSLTDAQTTALGSTFTGAWYLRVTAGTDTRTWSAGELVVLAPSTPGRGATTSMVGTIAIELTNTVGRGVATGGTTGQVLAKNSNDDYDTEWITAAGLGDMLKSENLSGLANYATARTNLGLVIGTNVQAFDADLSALAGLTSAADKGIQFTGSGAAGTYDLTTAGKALLDDASASAQRTTLGLVIGTDVSDVPTAKAETLIIAVGDETTAITTGTKVTFRMPFAFTLTAVRASLTTASSSGLPTVDINESGTTVLSTKLTIDVSELTSTTAATAAVISDSALADDAQMTIDIDVAGTGAAGLKVALIGTRA